MPRYDFVCDECEILWEKFILFSEYEEKCKKLKCPKCKKKKKVRQFLENKDIYGMVYQDPKTLGHQAERNTKEMGKYELESKLEKDKMYQIAETKNKYKPWYGTMDKPTRDKIQKSSGKEKKDIIKKYINEGNV